MAGGRHAQRRGGHAGLPVAVQTDGVELELAAVLALGAAVAGVLVPGAWRWTRHVVTIAHEGAHGLVALMTGRRLAGIRLHSDTSGVTVSVGPRRGPGMVAVLMVGYPGPALLGLGAAWLLSADRVTWLLWGLVVALALLLVQIRNWFGLLPVLATGFVVLAVTLWTPDDVQRGFAYAVVFFLLLAAPRPVLEMQTKRSRRRRDSDADQLARLTHVPGLLWVGFFLLVTLGALGVGVLLLV